MKFKVVIGCFWLLVACSSTTQKQINQIQPVEPIVNSPNLNSGGELKAGQTIFMLEEVDLAMSVYPEQRSIEAKAKLTIQALEELNQVVLDFDSRFEIKAVRYKEQTLVPSMYKRINGVLIIDLPSKISANESSVIEVRYGGTPHQAVKAPWQGGFVWQKTASGQPWIGTAIQGEGCDIFWPCIDHPSAEPKKVSLHVTVPKPLVVASNGVLLGVDEQETTRTYHWQTTISINAYAVTLNIAPYELIEDFYLSQYGNYIPVQYFHLPEHQLKAKTLFQEFKPMIAFLESRLGPYPFAAEKFAVVDSPYLGMEHQTINAYGNNYKIDQFGYDGLLQHEFAHEWFGNQITNVDWRDMWLHEAFATYMQPLYSQALHGEMAYMAQMYNYRAKITNAFPLVSQGAKSIDEVYQAEQGPALDIYFKGAHVLHTLRQLIGDEAFFQVLKLLIYGTTEPTLNNFSPQFADTETFIRYVNEVTEQDFQWFFDVYLFQAKLPELVITKKQNYWQFNWKTEQEVDFPMPIEVSLNGEVRKLTMKDIKALLVGPQDVVVIDPASKVLRHAEHIERYRQFIAQSPH